VPPSSGERFYLRLLLQNVSGCKSWQDIKTVNGVVSDTFKAAAQKHGLVEDDREWDECLQSAAVHASASQLRRLFVELLIFCQVGDHLALWNKHRDALCEDYMHRLRDLQHQREEQAQNMALRDIEKLLCRHGKALSDFPGLPACELPQDLQLNRLMLEHLDFDRDALKARADERVAQLNSDQRLVYDEVISSATATDTHARIFFVDGPGGTGKTFTYGCILDRLRSEGKICLSVASSGIAATLIDGSCTAHSQFKIPIDIDATSVCKITPKSELAELIKAATLILWDEAPMNHKFVFECVDRTFRDILRATNPALENIPFGGKLMVFGGDFRQCLPVVPKGGRSDIVAASMTRLAFWGSHVRIRRLTKNMRVESAIGNDAIVRRDFAQWLLKVGEDRDGTDLIELPESSVETDLNNMLQWLYPQDLLDRNDAELVNRAVLCPDNKMVDEINAPTTARLPGAEVTLLSADKLVDESNVGSFTPEFLNSLTPSGCPPHALKLKVGCPVMLLRNLDIKAGLCNGTRMIVTKISPRVLTVRLACGPNAGNEVLIPRIPIIPSDQSIAVKFRRLQFPIRVCFAMTINKAQGQTLKKAALYLARPVFSHGQLYVGTSRVSIGADLKVFTGNRGQEKIKTTNVVYREALL
jgi:hypothetical protein